jgi:hypothetical protein
VRRGLQLFVLFVLAPFFLAFSVIHGLWDWLAEIRQIEWRCRSMRQSIKYQFREIMNPGIHLREAIAAKMPTSYKANP